MEPVAVLDRALTQTVQRTAVILVMLRILMKTAVPNPVTACKAKDVFRNLLHERERKEKAYLVS